MKTFDDLIFEPHKAAPKTGIQASLELGNGKILSVIAGKGFYSSGKEGVRETVTKVEDASTFEVAILDPIHPDIDVVGWQSREDINEIIKNNGG